MNLSHRALWASTAMLLLSLSVPAVAGTPNPKQAAKAAPAAVSPEHISPHARAARARALARAESAPPSAGVRVSPYTTQRKPHKPAAAH